jgi:hypothetical protein
MNYALLINSLMLILIFIYSYSIYKVKFYVFFAIAAALASTTFITYVNLFQQNNNFDNGVSRASFIGINPEGKFYTTVILFIIVILVTYVVISFINRNRTLKEIYLVELISDHKQQSKSRSYFEFALILFIAVVSAGNLIPRRLDLIENWKPALLDWDVQNFDTWNGLFLQGYTPMKDFWYPYGNIIYLTAYPIKGFFLIVLLTISFIYLLRNAFKESEKLFVIRITLYLCTFLLLLDRFAVNDYFSVVRYGLTSVSIYSLISYILKREKMPFLVWVCISSAILISFSNAVLIFSVTYLVIFFYTLFIEQKKINLFLSKFLNYILSRNSVIMMIPLIFLVTNLVINRSISNEIRLLTKSSEYNQGWSFPMIFISKFMEDRDTYLVTFLGFFLIFILSILFIYVNKIVIKDFAFYIHYFSILGVCIFFILGLLKFSIRGPIHDLWIIVIVAIMILTSRIKLYKIFLFPVGAAIAALGYLNYSNLIQYKYLIDPTKISNERHIMQNQYANINNYAVKSSWVNILEYLNANSITNFATLTDNGYLYLQNFSKPYFHIVQHAYSTSYGNSEMLKYWTDDAPDYVILDLHTLNFEGVNAQLRSSELVQYTIKNYVFQFNSDEIYIFKKKSINDNLIDPTFFKIFSEVDLGNLTRIRYSNSQNTNICTANEEDCAPVLELKVVHKDLTSKCWFEWEYLENVSRFNFEIPKNTKVGDSIQIPLSKLWLYPMGDFSFRVNNQCVKNQTTIYVKNNKSFL